MSMKSRALGALCGVFAFVALSGAQAADRSYSEGPVSVVASIRTEPGRFDDYMAWLQSGWKKSLEAQKAAGVVLDYAVYTTMPRGPNDPDIYLVTTYKNMAAFDDLDAKVDPIQEKIFGTQQQMTQATIDRGKMRTVLGSMMIREAILK